MDFNQFTIIQKTEIYKDFLNLLKKQNFRTSTGTFAAVSLMFAIVLQHHDSLLIRFWAAVAILSQVFRIFLLKKSISDAYESLRKTYNYYIASALLTGLAFSFYLLFFKYLNLPEKSVVTLILVGLCCGSAANNVGQRIVFLTFSSPILLGLIVVWMTTVTAGEANWINYSMAFLIFLYSTVLLDLSKNATNMIYETFALRFNDSQQRALLEVALKQAETANRSKTRFLAAASHDLRQPLHTISLVSASLGLQKLDEKSLNHVKILNEVSQSLSGQLNDLLDISKLDAGIVNLDLKQVNINSLLQRIESEFGFEIEQKNLKFELALEARSEVKIDTQQMYRIIRNLVHNAVKFTHQGSIKIQSFDENDNVIVIVSDTGCGIADEYHQEIFQEFYQVGNSERDRAKGFGLGLSIVSRLAKLLNIDVKIRSKVGVGTSFELIIPATNINKSSNNHFDIANVQRMLGPSELKILIIDDEEIIRLSTSMLLTELGCQCATAANSDQAIDLASKEEFDLALVDYRLEKGDTGINIIHRMQSVKPQLNAVLVTGDSAPDLLQTIQNFGLRVIHKPLSLQQLASELLTIKQLKARKLAGATT